MLLEELKEQCSAVMDDSIGVDVPLSFSGSPVSMRQFSVDAGSLQQLLQWIYFDAAELHAQLD